MEDSELPPGPLEESGHPGMHLVNDAFTYETYVSLVVNKVDSVDTSN